MNFKAYNNIKFDKFFLGSLIMIIIYRTLVAINIVPNTGYTKILQYLIMIIPMILCSIKIYIDREILKEKYTYFYEIKKIVLVIGVFAIISFIKIISTKQFTTNTIMELLQLLWPFIYAFFIINFLNQDQIMLFMKISLIVTVMGYIYLIGIDSITISNILSISILDSYSPFENHIFAEVASGLAVYFVYYNKKAPCYCILAILLNFFIFKRVLMLSIVILLIVVILKKQDNMISKKAITVSIIVWSAIVIITYIAYQPAVSKFILSNTGFNLEEFTGYRIYRLWYVLENSFTSYGLGSTSAFLAQPQNLWVGVDFEMDFIRIMFELGPIAIVVLIYVYLKITRRNLYSYAIISVCFLNLLMANGLVMYFGWTFRIVTIALINYYDDSGNKIKPKY